MNGFDGSGEFHVLESTYTVPFVYDIDEFSLVMYNYFQGHAPFKTGYMASQITIDWDPGSRTVTFTSGNCPYSAYQQYETAYSGWWSEGLKDAYQYACNTVPKHALKNNPNWWKFMELLGVRLQ